MTGMSAFAELPSNLSKEDVKSLAQALGLTIEDEELEEVTHRFTALMLELNRLDQTDLGSVDPLPIFPTEEREV